VRARDLAIVVVTLLFLGLGCPPEPPPIGGAPDYDGPGSEAWGSEDIHCETEADCLAGEVCMDGVCQVDRCSTGLADSSPPIGDAFNFFQENEVAVADTAAYEGGYYVDGYGPSFSSLDYDFSWELGTDQIKDIAGGNLMGTRPEAYAAISPSRKGVALLLGDNVTWNNLDFYPEAIAVGDTDGDGLDEVVVIDAGQEMAVCDVNPWSCDYWAFSDTGIEQVDVAVGDVDGDTVEEPVVLLDFDGYRYLHSTNIDAEYSGQVDSWLSYVEGDHIRISSGDTNGDWISEVVVLLDGGWWGWWDDSIAVYNATDDGKTGEFVATFSYEIDGITDVADIAASDTDGDEIASVMVLCESANVMAFEASGLNFQRDFTTLLDVSVAPNRIAMADHDGDAPRAKLVQGPVHCQGAVVPVNILVMPPYHADHAAGFPSSVMYGDVESTSESFSDTVSLGLHVDVGVGASFFDIFKAEVSEKVTWHTSQTVTLTDSMFVGARYCMRAYPDVYGPYYAGVVLSWGCFDGYVYEVEDPSSHVGGDGEQFAMIVPTGGSVSLWSSKRYNSLAEELGNLPIVDVPYAVGTVDTYPTEPETLGGDPIPTTDNMFPNPGQYTVSDVGETVWWMGVETNETNDLTTSVEIGASANVAVAGIKIGGGASMGWGEGYSLRTGNQATFAGSIPTLRDDPDTPEDEYAIYSYSVEPFVYVEHYTAEDGTEGAYYVQTYTQTSH
jgi:hypothetical protein